MKSFKYLYFDRLKYLKMNPFFNLLLLVIVGMDLSGRYDETFFSF